MTWPACPAIDTRAALQDQHSRMLWATHWRSRCLTFLPILAKLHHLQVRIDMHVCKLWLPPCCAWLLIMVGDWVLVNAISDHCVLSVLAFLCLLSPWAVTRVSFVLACWVQHHQFLIITTAFVSWTLSIGTPSLNPYQDPLLCLRHVNGCKNCTCMGINKSLHQHNMLL